jgi:hypothetical protein
MSDLELGAFIALAAAAGFGICGGMYWIVTNAKHPIWLIPLVTVAVAYIGGLGFGACSLDTSCSL